MKKETAERDPTPQIIISIIRIVVVHVHLTIISIEVEVRDAAVHAFRIHLESPKTVTLRVMSS